MPRDNLKWAYAKVGRFNDDDLPDVLVSFANNQLDVDVLGNSGDGRFTPFTVRTDQVVRRIGAGDFDGDRIDDVAFLQSTDPSPDGPADLYIAFGSPTGAPEAAHLVGKLKYAHSLLSLRDSTIGVDDLSITSTAPEPAGNTQGFTGNEVAVTVLFGSGSRTQVAPLFMIDPTDNTSSDAGVATTTVGPTGSLKPTSATETAQYWQPVSFSIGPFIVPGPNQIVSIATHVVVTPTAADPSKRLSTDHTSAWFAGHDVNAVGGIDPFVQVTHLDDFVGYDHEAISEGQLELAMVTASGDVDYPVAAGQEVDELVTITQSILDRSQLWVYIVRPKNDLGGQPTVPLVAAKIPNASILGSDPIQIVDIDADHNPDVVFIITADNVRKLDDHARRRRRELRPCRPRSRSRPTPSRSRRSTPVRRTSSSRSSRRRSSSSRRSTASPTSARPSRPRTIPASRSATSTATA